MKMSKSTRATPARPGAITDRWALFVVVMMSLVLLGLVARVAQLQAAPPEGLVPFLSDRQSRADLPGRRGDVLDRRGRVLAATRFGVRVFVDPEEFAVKDKELNLERLARVLGQDREAVQAKVSAAMIANEKAKEQAQSTGEKPRLDRVIFLTPDVIDEATEQAVRDLRLRGVHLERREVRSVVGGPIAERLVGVVGFEGAGLTGAEARYDEKLQGEDGEFRFVRDSRGRPLWVPLGGVTPPSAGRDVRLSFDLEIQRILDEEVNRGVIDADAQGGRGVILDLATGEVLAMSDVRRTLPDVVEYDWLTVIPKDKGLGGPRYLTIKPDENASNPRNRVVEDVYEPGSTFKSFMWAAALEAGVVRLDEVFDTGGGRWTTPYGRPIADVVRRGTQNWREVLVNSSNIGMVKGTSRLTFEQMRNAVTKFGFGSRTGIGLGGETAGIVTPMSRWTKYTQTSVAIGHEVAVTPIQMVRAFAAVARGGELAGLLPDVTLLAKDPGATSEAGANGKITLLHRVLRADTAAATRETLRGVTHKMDENLKKATGEEGWRYELFGKSGTAEIPLGEPPKGKRRPRGSDGYFKGQYNSSFIAAGPFEQPKLVCLVIIDDPGPERIARKQHYGSWVAGPVVRRVMDRSLAYLGVPASAKPTGDGVGHEGD
ncbi:MAG: peptidoglycan D,D-transpeptidase FtsI family protein [Phycisphaerales bacterium]|jgi:cell division protein FtsI (penicillin-binding protein 3)|nr:penicillin-binding protein 2 [Phycisphaeraceae bacterium]